MTWLTSAACVVGKPKEKKVKKLLMLRTTSWSFKSRATPDGPMIFEAHREVGKTNIWLFCADATFLQNIRVCPVEVWFDSNHVGMSSDLADSD